jgi:hypothetical protein
MIITKSMMVGLTQGAVSKQRQRRRLRHQAQHHIAQRETDQVGRHQAKQDGEPAYGRTMAMRPNGVMACLF